ncbi:hypothetical protein B0H12DRAFT_1165957 [Mycena haematopus]|nr:hypothetical protein B0H12DRAFT_1165957 [Mycena haematopus]
MMVKNRKATYKVATNLSESQELRRKKALEEQKRKRAQRVDSSRHLDLFADLNLGQSDDEEGAEDPEIVRMGIVSYAPLLPPSAAEAPASDTPMKSVPGSEPPAERKKKKRKPKSKKEYSAAGSKWADQCMYAELLEMNEDNSWNMSDSSPDGLPEDLETGWVAVGPVPVGKRCLAVTDQSLGVPGLGKLLMPRFPSTLPPLTILDCFLDNNWRENGLLHVLDVLKWKGQDIGGCEAPFRFWWRDTRLGELSPSPPPSSHYSQPFDPTDVDVGPKHYCFPYPTKFLAVPYHLDTSLPALASHIVPFARASRFIDVAVPADDNPEPESMTVDQSSSREPRAAFTTRRAEVCSDGLLLYVAEASYESGTSPLSTWIPVVKYEEDPTSDAMTEPNTTDGPLDIFYRLVLKRIARRSDGGCESRSLTMDVET